jgi:hypothetical protein
MHGDTSLRGTFSYMLLYHYKWTLDVCTCRNAKNRPCGWCAELQIFPFRHRHLALCKHCISINYTMQMCCTLSLPLIQTCSNPACISTPRAVYIKYCHIRRRTVLRCITIASCHVLLCHSPNNGTATAGPQTHVFLIVDPMLCANLLMYELTLVQNCA